MDEKRAADLLEALADGYDPFTGEVLQENSPYNNPEIIRALFYVVKVLKENKAKTKDSVDASQSKHLNAGLPWSQAEDEELHKEFCSGMTITQIAKTHNRTYGAIQSRLKKHKLIEE